MTEEPNQHQSDLDADKILQNKNLKQILWQGVLSKHFFDKTGHNFKHADVSKLIMFYYPIVTLKDTDEIYVYNEKNGLYEANGDKTIREKVRKILGDDYCERYAKLVVDYITVSTYIERKDFTVPIQFLPVKNSVLNINQNPVILLPFDKKYYFTSQLPVVYNPEAKCPDFFKFLSDILPDEKYRLQIQEMFGWCLWRKPLDEVAFMLVGEGSNGRSTLLNVLRTLLGNENVSAQTLQRLSENNFSSSRLYQKYANIAPDISSLKIRDSSIFKTLTGRDLVTAEEKFCSSFEFENYAKMIFSTNKLPYCYDKTYAWYRRWIIITFNVRFGGGGLPADKNILEKITTPEEMSGILNWALEGLRRWKEKGEFTERLSVEETEIQYTQLVSPVYAFLNEQIEESAEDDDFIPKDYLFENLKQYCLQNKLTLPKSKKQVATAIKKVFPNIQTGQRAVGGKLTYVWLYCRFTDNIKQGELQATIEKSSLKSTFREEYQ